MNQSFGGKKGRVASSSDLLRAVRISVQTGANASYKNDPKKTRAAGDSSGEVLGRSIMPGLFTELSTLVGTVNPYIPPPPPVPLTFVTQYMIAMFPNLVNQPIVVFSGDGNLYVVGDANNGTGSSILYRVAPNGIYGQVGTINMSTKAAIIGNDGYMYIVGGKGIVKCSPTDGSYTYVATTGIVSPKGITQSPITGVLYVTSGTQVLSISNGQIDQITIGKTCIGIVYATDGYLYVSTAEGGIYRVNPQNRTFVPYIATSRNFYTLIQANDGLLYGTVYGLGVYRITPSNGVIEQFGPPLSGTALFYGITQSSDESLYVTAADGIGQKIVYRIQVNDLSIRALSITLPDVSPSQTFNTTYVAFSTDGYFYVTTDKSSILYKVSADLRSYTTLSIFPTTNGDYGNKGIITGNDGYLYICGSNLGLVRFSPTNNTYTSLGQLGSTYALTQSPSGDVYVTEFLFDISVYRRQTGRLEYFVGLDNFIMGIIYANDGFIYASVKQIGIVKINPVTTSYSTYIPIVSDYYTTLIQVPNGLLYGTSSNGGIDSISLTTKTITNISPPFITGRASFGLTQAPSGIVYATTTDTTGQTILYQVM